MLNLLNVESISFQTAGKRERPVSNLYFISKLIECACLDQLYLI